MEFNAENESLSKWSIVRSDLLEIAGRITKLQYEWRYIEDGGPYSPRDVIDKLWADMRRAGLAPSSPSDMPESRGKVFFEDMKNFTQAEEEMHTEYHVALCYAQSLVAFKMCDESYRIQCGELNERPRM